MHRHPPNHGLGSNTCIQDAHNLAWKVAHVHKGKAGKKLLDSFNLERQPVGLDVVTQANASLRNHGIVWQTLGCFEPNVAERTAANAELSSPSVEGLKRRQKLQTALRGIDREEHGLGIEMNQRYTSSAIYIDDRGEMPQFERDALEHYHPTTWPGARLPHVWLSPLAIPSRLISTIDLAGKGRFALLTGIGGESWKAAAAEVSQELQVPVIAYSIGYGQDYKDVYLDWTKIRGVTESGCALVRPDYFVCWRCQEWKDDGKEQLKKVMRSVLSLE